MLFFFLSDSNIHESHQTSNEAITNDRYVFYKICKTGKQGDFSDLVNGLLNVCTSSNLSLNFMNC